MSVDVAAQIVEFEARAEQLRIQAGEHDRLAAQARLYADRFISAADALRNLETILPPELDGPDPAPPADGEHERSTRRQVEPARSFDPEAARLRAVEAAG